MQSKFKKQPIQAQQRPQSQMPFRPGMPQGGMPMRRPMTPTGLPQRQVPVSPRPFPKDNELDATLKKLKDM